MRCFFPNVLCVAARLAPFALLVAGLSAQGVDSQLLNLAPEGTRVIGGVDVTQARTSPFGQYLVGQITNVSAADQHFQEFVAQTGFDPRQDIQQLLMVTNGDKKQPVFAVLARATYDKANMEAAATATGATIITYQGVDMILDQNHQSEENNKQVALAFIDTGVLALGDSATLQQIIANRAAPGSVDPTLLKEVQRISANNDAWFVSIVPGADFASHMNMDGNKNLAQAQVLQAILGSSGGIKFGDQVTISADATTRTAQDASSLADVVRLGVGMIEMQAPKGDARASIVASALENMSLTATGNGVHLGISFTETQMEQLAQADNRAHNSKLTRRTP